jgi:hypothetical protein
MPYCHFKKLTDVTKKFNLNLQTVVLFPSIKPIELSQYLTICLDAAEKVGYANEKERSERLVSPILTELTLHNHTSIVVYSGRDLFVDDKQGLNGECDFLISVHKKVIDELIAPVIAIVEAKEQDLRYGVAQCAAQLYGAKLFNEAEGFPIPCFYLFFRICKSFKINADFGASFGKFPIFRNLDGAISNEKSRLSFGKLKIFRNLF